MFTKQAANKQTFMQVLLAKHKADNKFYAVKVLQKKVILKKKEVNVCFEVQRTPESLRFWHIHWNLLLRPLAKICMGRVFLLVLLVNSGGFLDQQKSLCLI